MLIVNHIRETSPAGRLLERVLDLDFDTQRFQVDWSDISAEEAAALKILAQERDKWNREETDRQRDEAERQRGRPTH